MSVLRMIKKELDAAVAEQDRAVQVAACNESVDAVRYKAGVAEGMRRAMAIIKRFDYGE